MAGPQSDKDDDVLLDFLRTVKLWVIDAVSDDDLQQKVTELRSCLPPVQPRVLKGMLRYQFSQAETWRELTPTEQLLISADEFAQLRAWAFDGE